MTNRHETPPPPPPPPPFREGERVFLLKPSEQTGEARKFARPFHGPYRLREMQTNTAKIVRVDQPAEEPLLVSLSRLRRCPAELGEEFWLPDSKGRTTKKRTPQVIDEPTSACRSSGYTDEVGLDQSNCGAVGVSETGGRARATVETESGNPSAATGGTTPTSAIPSMSDPQPGGGSQCQETPPPSDSVSPQVTTHSGSTGGGGQAKNQLPSVGGVEEDNPPPPPPPPPPEESADRGVSNGGDAGRLRSHKKGGCRGRLDPQQREM